MKFRLIIGFILLFCSQFAKKFNKQAPTTCNQWTDGPLKEDDIKVILDTHNELRNQIALKAHIRKDSRFFPEASNMLQMYWSNDIALKAQQWADKCTDGESDPEIRKQALYPTGENIRYIPRTAQYPRIRWKKIIHTWFNEIKNFGSKVERLGEGTNVGIVSHFTQMIWANSYQIGCGYARFPSQSLYVGLYVCQYGPSGNHKGQPIYKSEGGACQSCQKGTQCENLEYPGLCCPTDFCSEKNVYYTGPVIPDTVFTQ